MSNKKELLIRLDLDNEKITEYNKKGIAINDLNGEEIQAILQQIGFFEQIGKQFILTADIDIINEFISLRDEDNKICKLNSDTFEMTTDKYIICISKEMLRITESIKPTYKALPLYVIDAFENNEPEPFESEYFDCLDLLKDYLRDNYQINSDVTKIIKFNK